jgi:hypothetical protein
MTIAQHLEALGKIEEDSFYLMQTRKASQYPSCA